jgi:hypothetical protein
MKDSPTPRDRFSREALRDRLRGLATRALTGGPGRLTAFTLDLAAGTARYAAGRLRGREAPW